MFFSSSNPISPQGKAGFGRRMRSTFTLKPTVSAAEGGGDSAGPGSAEPRQFSLLLSLSLHRYLSETFQTSRLLWDRGIKVGI